MRFVELVILDVGLGVPTKLFTHSFIFFKNMFMECLLHAKCCDGYWRKKWRTEGMWSLLLVYYWE